MASAFKLLPHYTYTEYLQWEGQWELIEGIPHAMSPAPRPEHQAVAGALHAEFRAAIKIGTCSCQVYQPIDYKVTDDTVLNPDLLVVCQPIEKAFLDFAPVLVAEILSPATALKDRHTKFDIYEQQGIPYYLIVAIKEQQVEVYHLQASGKYALVTIPDLTKAHFELNTCRIIVDLSAIWS